MEGCGPMGGWGPMAAAEGEGAHPLRARRQVSGGQLDRLKALAREHACGRSQGGRAMLGCSRGVRLSLVVWLGLGRRRES